MAEKNSLRILKIASQLFKKEGYGGTTIRDVAANAHVTEGAIFRIFHSKELLLAQVIRCKILGTLNPNDVDAAAASKLEQIDVARLRRELHAEMERLLKDGEN